MLIASTHVGIPQVAPFHSIFDSVLLVLNSVSLWLSAGILPPHSRHSVSGMSSAFDHMSFHLLYSL